MRASGQRISRALCVAICAFGAIAACGSKREAAPVPAAVPRDAAVVPDAAPELAARPLGLADLAAWKWRERAGHAAVKDARLAEARDDWAGVAAACERALAADPTHLEASWLLAIAQAKLGKLDAVVGPLQVAAAGDVGKWGLASLEHPALKPFLATPAGQAWQRRADADRAAFVATVAQSLIVIAAGDVFAYDLAGTRWYRLTRTNGSVLAALRAQRQLIYLARKSSTEYGVGIVDLATGKTYQPLGIGAGIVELGFSESADAVWLYRHAPGAKTRLYAHHAKDALQVMRPPSPWRRPKGPWLGFSAAAGPVLHRWPDAIAADWDDSAFASAIRVASTARVLTVAGQIDGTSIVWSPDHAQLAFTAMLRDPADECLPDAPAVSAHLADAGTGTVRELATAQHGLAVEWLSDHRVALAGDDGVAVLAADGTRTPIVGATDLLTPRRRPLCRPPAPPAVIIDGGTPDAALPPEPVEPEPAEPE